MNCQALLELQDERPFHTVASIHSYGSHVVIEHPKWMMLAPNERTPHCVFRQGPGRQLGKDHFGQAVSLERTGGAVVSRRA